MVGVIEAPVASVENGAPAVSKPAPVRRVKRLERPNKAEFDEAVGKLRAEMDGLHLRVQDIKAILDNRQLSKGVLSPELVEAKGRLTALNHTFKQVLEAKNALRDELNALDKERDRKRAEARALRDNLPYSRVEQVDEETKKLEYRLAHTSLTLQEEKKVLQQIKDLTKQRDIVKESSHDDGLKSTLIENIKEKDKLLNSLKAQEQQQRKVLADIKEKEASLAVNVPALIDERNTAYDRIKVLRDELKDLRTEFRAKEDEFWEREREWREQQAVERKLAFEKREAERLEREQYRKQKELENFVEPYTDEIILCDQLFHYLQKFAPTTEEAASNPASSKVEIQAPKGVGNVILSKKNRNDEDLDSWFSLSGGKSKGKKASGSSAVKNREKEKISLSLDVLTSFGKVKLSPPTTVGDVAKSIEEVKSKKEHFVQLQNEDREAREVKAKKEAEIAATPVVEVADAPEPEALQEDSQESKNEVSEEVEVVEATDAPLN